MIFRILIMTKPKKIQFQIKKLNDLAKKQKTQDEIDPMSVETVNVPMTVDPVNTDYIIIDPMNENADQVNAEQVNVCTVDSEPVNVESDLDMSANSCNVFQSGTAFQCAAPEEIFAQYLDFIRMLPELIPSVRQKLLHQVVTHLKISVSAL